MFSGGWCTAATLLEIMGGEPTVTAETVDLSGKTDYQVNATAVRKRGCRSYVHGVSIPSMIDARLSSLMMMLLSRWWFYCILIGIMIGVLCSPGSLLLLTSRRQVKHMMPITSRIIQGTLQCAATPSGPRAIDHVLQMPIRRCCRSLLFVLLVDDLDLDLK